MTLALLRALCYQRTKANLRYICVMRVLIIDNDDKLVCFLRLGFEAECFAVDNASNGKEGSFLARTTEYDVIILENALLHKTGKEVCLEIRNQGKMTPILVLSHIDDVATKVDLLHAGADDYMVKPFSFDELLARVRALLRRPLTMVGDVLNVGGLCMDINRHLVTCDGKAIRLTCKEFTLLEYLMRNQGMVLSRASIMDHVWDMYADPFSNTIESHILSVRKKISTLSERKLIHTISGIGYIMDIREEVEA